MRPCGVGRPGRREGARVVRGADEVGDERYAARLQDARDSWRPRPPPARGCCEGTGWTARRRTTRLERIAARPRSDLDTPATPSASAFWRTSAVLPVRSQALQMSIPTAVPVVSLRGPSARGRGRYRRRARFRSLPGRSSRASGRAGGTAPTRRREDRRAPPGGTTGRRPRTCRADHGHVRPARAEGPIQCGAKRTARGETRGHEEVPRDAPVRRCRSPLSLAGANGFMLREPRRRGRRSQRDPGRRRLRRDAPSQDGVAGPADASQVGDAYGRSTEATYASWATRRRPPGISMR